MKIRLIALLTTIIIVAISCSKEKADVNTTPQNTLKSSSVTYVCNSLQQTLWAGKTIDAGTVTVTNDNDFVYVTYQTTGDWYITETHLNVSTTIPTVKGSPGQYNYNSYGPANPLPTGTQSVVYTFPRTNFTCDQIIYIMAHAAVQKIVSGVVIDSQTGFGGPVVIPQKGAWFGYITYQITCCTPPPPPPTNCTGDTGFGGITAGSTAVKPAWWFYFDVTKGETQTIWAGKTKNAGTATYKNGTITIKLADGWSLQQGNNESVKVQGYTTLPDSRPIAGQFTTYKGFSLSFPVTAYPYYVIHLDLTNCK